MVILTRVRQLAKRTLSVGANRLRFRPGSEDKNDLLAMSKIRSRAGIRLLVNRGYIEILRKKPSNSPRTKSIRRIPKGTLKTRLNKSGNEYVIRTRILRQRLKEASSSISDRKAYWSLYRSIKSGKNRIFRTLDIQIANLQTQ